MISLYVEKIHIYWTHYQKDKNVFAMRYYYVEPNETCMVDVLPNL